MKKIISLILILVLSMTAISAEANMVEVAKNSISLTLNGTPVDADNLLYEGRTYVQLHTISQMINADLSWNGDTRTADLSLTVADSSQSSTTSKTIYLNDYYKPLASYDTLGLQADDIYGVMLKKANSHVSYAVEDEGIRFTSLFPMDSSFNIQIIKQDMSRIDYTVIHKGLPDLTQKENGNAVVVPASPEDGFNFPYVVYIPATHFYKDLKSSEKNYIIVDTINNGVDKTLEDCLDDAIQTVTRASYAADQATILQYPMIMPVFQRNSIRTEMDGYGVSYSYEHALDRDSVFFKELVTTDSHASSNIKNFKENNIDPSDYYDFDDQIAAMLSHAVDYVNSEGYDVEDKVIMYGYSASGSFAERFTALHPESVEILFAGANNDDMLLPTNSYKGETLNYPIGTADYQTITGRAFDLEAYNNVAKVIYMGKDDTNQVVGYSDCYYEETNNQYGRLFASTVLERAYETEKLFGDSGGKGIFILDQGVGHSMSSEARDYVIDFIIANAASSTPVYPKPTVSRLEYTIFE